MAEQSLKRQLKVLTVPVFIEMALVMMLGAVDTVMLSRYSDNSVAAVGLDNQLMSLVFLVYQFFSMGAAIICAQYIGAGLRGDSSRWWAWHWSSTCCSEWASAHSCSSSPKTSYGSWASART